LENLLYIYVCGCVNTPGVFKCQEGSRVYELIEQAGGFSADADETGLNLVDVVKDGQKLYVPSKEEKTVAAGGGTTTEQKKPLLNINKATKEQLMTLPGIGESKANDIISYRTTNGAFKSTEDIMNVAGIKDAAYTKIKDYICVN
jgi:competence protein ComEA